jgi:glycosyltransferase involved in cell wall biosynthesis
MNTFITNNDVTVSAIIAVYNPDPNFFKQAVLSVLDQIYPVLELVLVNDGGSEHFRDLLPDDSRLRVFSKQNEGVAATRNFAIRQCRGEYIAFLDQDDYWYPDKLQEQIAMIQVHKEPCMVSSPIHIVNHRGIILDSLSEKCNKVYRFKTLTETVLLNLTEGNFIYSSTPLIHSLVFVKAGGFDPWTQPHDDWDMFLRVILSGFPVYFYQQKPLSVWRKHESNESNKENAMMRSKCRVEKKLLQMVKDEAVRKIAATNLLIDNLDRDNLLYKKRQYVQFRKLTKYHILQLLLDKRNYIWHTTALLRKLSHRVHKMVFKSARRFVVSYFSS